MFGVSINDEFIDLPPSDKLTFELNLGCFSNDVIPGSLSYPNNLPPTDKNNRLLNNTKEIDKVTSKKIFDGVFYAFGAPYDRCKVIRLESNKNVYRVSIILSGVSVDILGKTLRDIDTSAELASFDRISEVLDFINDCNSENSNSIFTWPRIKNESAFEGISDAPYIDNYYGGILNPFTNGTTINPYAKKIGFDNYFKRYYLSPMIREIRLLELLFSQYGYKVSGSFINDIEQRDLAIFSNKIFKVESADLIHTSLAEYAEAPIAGNHIPNLGIGANIMDQDHNALVDVFYNHPTGGQFPDGTMKIKLDTSKKYRIGFRAKITATTNFVTPKYWFVQQSVSNPTFGEVAFEVPGSIMPTIPSEETLVENCMEIDFSSGFPSVDPFVYLLVALDPNNIGGVPDFTMSDATFQVIEVDVDENDAIIEKLNPSEFLPNKPIDEWLTGLKENFNLNIYFNPFSREVVINYKESLLSAPIENIDYRMGDLIPLKTLDNQLGYEFDYNFDSLEDDLIEGNIISFNNSDIKGYLNSSTTGNNEFYLSASDGFMSYYFGGSRKRIGRYFQNQLIGDGIKKYIPQGRAPMLMDLNQLQGLIQPVLKVKMSYSRYALSNYEYQDIRMAYYRYLVPSSNGLVEHPTASSFSVAADEDTSIGFKELWFNIDRPNSIYNQCFRKWLSFERTTERLRDNIQIDQPFIQSFYNTQKQLGNTVFIADKLIFTVEGDSIKEAEIEMYKNNYEYEPPE
jgi:hypothetical protein